MKDLAPKREGLVEEYRVELAVQVKNDLAPHFPNNRELLYGQKVLDVLVNERKPYGQEPEMDTVRTKIFSFVSQFYITEETGTTVWYGKDIILRPHLGNKDFKYNSYCVDTNGEIGTVVKLGDEMGGYFEEFQETRSSNMILGEAPKFVFSTQSDMDKTIDEWYEARKLINKYGAKLSVEH